MSIRNPQAELALQDEDLVAEGENLGVARIARGEHPSKSGQNESSEDGKQGHERRTLPTVPMPETPAIAVRMSIRHLHAKTPAVRGG
jgi:hypothetical protein